MTRLVITILAVAVMETVAAEMVAVPVVVTQTQAVAERLFV
jgi:hypothetical protein